MYTIYKYYITDNRNILKMEDRYPITRKIKYAKAGTDPAIVKVILTKFVYNNKKWYY